MADATPIDRKEVPIDRSDGELRSKVEWVLLFRVVAVTLLLGSAIVANVNDVESFSDPSYLALASLIVATYVGTVATGLWLRRGANVERTIFAQLIGDVLLIGGLVLATGGVDSMFPFLFFLVIFNGANLLGKIGANFAASVASLCFACIVIVEVVSVPWLVDAFPSLAAATSEVTIYPVVIHLVAFFTVAFLAGYLAEKLGQVGTELRRRRVDLQALQELNKHIVDSIRSGLISVDASGRILMMNESASAILGVDADQMDTLDQLSMPLADLIRESDTVSRRQLEIRKADGELRVIGLTVSKLTLPDDEREGSLLIFQDLTDVRLLEDEIQRKRHLASIGEISAAIAHEIRNPLAAISGAIEVLRMGADAGDEESQALTGIVLREVDRLNGLVGDFLTYARPIQLHRREVSVGDAVNPVVRAVQQEFGGERPVRFAYTHDEPEFLLTVDVDRLQQVMWNLLRNGAQAAAPDGRVAVTTYVDADHRQKPLVIVVEDDGPGIPPEAVDRLFEPFFTTKPGGTGLGLATCHRIIGEHGGVLVGQNLRGVGAQFLIALPTVLGPSGLPDVLQDYVPSAHASTMPLAVEEIRAAEAR